ncbi:MAG TPA: HD domain-containing protein [Pirellulales bacterium]|nr:HD domain-containing protein [Pirellulales bacterium]
MSDVREIVELFESRGDSLYGGEAVTQLEHALQAALLAEEEGAPPELIAAALLHDVGHLLHDLPDDAPDAGVDDRHENSAANYLGKRFSRRVTEAVRLHVAAKRYLCAVDERYLSSLSQPSIVSLQLQGGPMTPAEVAEFERHPYFDDSVRLRRWDDAAKIPHHPTPPLAHFARYVAQAALESRPA